MPESSLTYRPPVTPSSRARLSALTSLVQPGLMFGLSATSAGTGSSGAYRQMLSGPASIRLRSSSGSPLGRSYATSSGPKHSSQAKIGPSGDAVAALAAGQRGGGTEVDGARGGVVESVVLATVCTAMEARPFLLIFLTTHLATRRNWHLPQPGASRADHDATRPAGGLPGLQRAVPSAPLDERYGSGSWIRAFVHATTPDMRWSSALFKTVTEGPDG